MKSMRKKKVLRWLSLSGVMLIIASVILFAYQDYSLRGFSNATFIPGIILLFLFLLKLLKNGGAFDVVSYGVSRMIHGITKKTTKDFKEANEYLEDKRIERRSQDNYFWPEVVVASVFILAGAVLAFI